MIEAPAMPAPTNYQGFLAIFSDVKPEDETDYLHWLTREHAQERLAVPGFLSVRVFRAQAEDAARFLIFYRLTDSAVVASEAYLARLNAPSAWSQRIMPKLSNFMRGGGQIVHEAGAGEGMLAVPVIFDASGIERYRAAADEAVKWDRVTAGRIAEVDQAATTIATHEKAMRTHDASFSAMLLLEGLDEEALRTVAALLPAPDAGELAIYRQVFAQRTSRG
jgi:hypothetical protein